MALRKREIILSPQAENDLENIYAYLVEEWGETVLINFVAALNDFLFIVAYHPRMFAYINKNLNLRKHLLYKHNLVVYKNTRRNIEIVAILNAHENPTKLNKTLRTRV